MNPINFPQSNVVLTPPAGMSEKECGSLYACRTGQHHISKWRLSWRERLRVLFTGDIWVWVWMAHTQPPIGLDVNNPWPKESWLLKQCKRVWSISFIRRWRMKQKVKRAVRDALKERVL